MPRFSRAAAHSVNTNLRALLAVVLALVGLSALAASAQAFTEVDLSNYKRVGHYDLPEPTRTAAPANNLLAQEASGVTYDWDTETLFVVGDGGTSVTQVSKTGELVNTMTLPPGGSPQGTEFYDTEGIAYIGNGEFVMTEERDRQAVKFTYVPGGTLTREAAKTVKLGTTIGNVGLEGVSNDPLTSGFLFVKEIGPTSIFQTGIDWEAGTATNGGPTATGSTDLFNPSLTGLIDFSDVFALANVSNLTGPQQNNLLIISQESGKVIDVDRSGKVSSTLTLIRDSGNPLTIPAQTHEGVTMDSNGVLYTVNENGGGDANHPQLWVFEPSATPNQAPTGVTLTEQTASIQETTSTSTRLKVAEPVVADDGIGANQYLVTGPDASFFEVDSNGLYLKAGTSLNAATKSAYQVSVQVQDPTVSDSSPVTSAVYTLTVTSTSGASSGTALAVTEVSPWSSGDSSYKADWWELTNTGTKKVDLTGWRMDDDSAAFSTAVALNGVSSLAPGESAIFLEGTASTAEAFKTAWFGGSPPPGLKVGTYSGSGVGLSTGGDQVNIFNAGETRVTGVAFGSSTSGRTFDNTAAAGSATAPLPILTTLSSAGVNGAFTVGSETGSPGIAQVKTPVIVSEAAPWGSGSDPSGYAADWWELTNISGQAIDLSGWKMDDESNAFGSAVALNGVSSLAPGESAVFIEGDASKAAAFETFWFGASVPAGFQIGTYSGSGVGLSSSADQVNVFNAEGFHLTGVKFGSSTSNFSFDNAAGLGSYGAPPAISTLSASGVNGAFVAHDQTGSPGTIKNPPPVPPSIKITEVSPTSSSNSTYKADWWELTNTGASTVSLEGWKMDDDSGAFGTAVTLNGVAGLAAGESAIFIEGTASTAEAFKTAWFGSSVPAGFKVGSYSGSGVGLGSGGDQVNIFDSGGAKVTGVRFGGATTGVSFDNAAGLGSYGAPPAISTLSASGVNGAFVAHDQTGSPGTIKNPPPVPPSIKITEVSPTSSSNSTYKADWWELTNTGASTVSLEGWKMDDDSGAFGTAVTLNGVAGLAAGESAIFIEGTASTAEAFKTAWFGSSVPAGFKVGSYSGSGVGLGSGGDQVNIFDSGGAKVTGVRFGGATTGVSFDNAAGIGSNTESPPPLISTLSVNGVNGAFVAGGETGSPGTIKNPPPVQLQVTLAGTGGGTVSSSPAGIDCGPTCEFSFNAGTLVKLTGAADAGSEPVVWSGCDVVNGSNECEVTLAANANVTATFDLTPPPPPVDCSGASITGEGSTLQGVAQQQVWGPEFEGFCPSIDVKYEATGSAAGLRAWDFNGPDGTPFDTSRAFVATDDAPTAAQISNAESAASGAKALVIPVAQTAIGVIVNPPPNCDVNYITNVELEEVFKGITKNWGKLLTAEGAGCTGAPITRVVRPAGSGTTYQFKNYLYAASKKAALPCTVGKATWQQLEEIGAEDKPNINWPESGVNGCGKTQLSPVARPAGNTGSALVGKVNTTDGSIGYAALPDIEAAKSGDTHWVNLQNNGLVKLSQPAEFASPLVEGNNSANCAAAKYAVPKGARTVAGSGESVDWSQVFGGNVSIGGGNYPLCTLTFDVALSGYGKAGLSAGQATTAKAYLFEYITDSLGQAAIANAGKWYAALPTAAKTERNVLGAAQLSASKIQF